MKPTGFIGKPMGFMGKPMGFPMKPTGFMGGGGIGFPPETRWFHGETNGFRLRRRNPLVSQ